MNAREMLFHDLIGAIPSPSFLASRKRVLLPEESRVLFLFYSRLPPRVYLSPTAPPSPSVTDLIFLRDNRLSTEASHNNRLFFPRFTLSPPCLSRVHHCAPRC